MKCYVTNSLVTDAANNDEHVVGGLPTLSTSTQIDARDDVASASLSVFQFEMMFPGNHSSQVYFWEAYRHSIAGGSLGGMKGLFTRSTQRSFHSTEDTLMSLDDAALMFKIMDHALNCKGEQQQNFFRIASGLFHRKPSHSFPSAKDRNE